MAMETRMQRRN
uniref:Uncharacterized protein n=1 Tax=Rhizophora mucronata TaxID=61149 RepID=A0A2P2Q262_RHIMU